MKFKAAKVMNLSLICVLSALICLVLKHYTILRGGGHDIGLMNLYSAIFPISTIAWWFMTAYIMVLLISPFIENGIKLIAKKEFICVLVFMTLIEVLSIPAMRNFGSSFFGLLYIYLLGRYLSMYKIKLTGKKALLLFICMTALLMICLETLYFLPIKNSALFWFLQFNNPIIILQAVSLFFIVLNLKPIYNRHINKILQPCLCIYLLTELTQPYKLIVAQLDSNPILGIGIIIGALIVCLALGQVIAYLADKIVCFSIPKVSNRFTM